jgi:hypothetical protein
MNTWLLNIVPGGAGPLLADPDHDGDVGLGGGLDWSRVDRRARGPRPQFANSSAAMARLALSGDRLEVVPDRMRRE